MMVCESLRWSATVCESLQRSAGGKYDGLRWSATVCESLQPSVEFRGIQDGLQRSARVCKILDGTYIQTAQNNLSIYDGTQQGVFGYPWICHILSHLHKNVSGARRDAEVSDCHNNSFLGSIWSVHTGRMIDIPTAHRFFPRQVPNCMVRKPVYHRSPKLPMEPPKLDLTGFSTFLVSQTPQTVSE